MADSTELPDAGLEWTRTRAILGTIITVLAVAALLWLSYALRTVAMLVVFAVLFAYVLAPVVALFERPFSWRKKQRRMPRAGAIAIVYLGGLGVAATALSLIVPRIISQLGALDEQLPAFLGRQQAWAQSIADRYHSYRLPAGLRDALDLAAIHATTAVHQSFQDGLVSAVGFLRFLPWVVLIPVISIFLLADAPMFRTSVLSLFPQGRARWRGGDFFEDANRTIAFFVRAQLLACLFIGVVCSIGFFALGVPYALLLGVFAGLLELIPMVGPLTLAVTALLLASSQSPQLVVSTLVFLVVLRVVNDNAVYPRLIASGMKLHPLAVTLALLSGAQLAGVLGLFLAIPITAFLSVCYRHLNRQWHANGLIAKLLEAREPEPVSVPPVRAVDELPLFRGGEGPLAGLRLLVVDDDKDGQAMLADLLETQGALVSRAGSVDRALRLLSEQRFDVLISDIGMPGEDGFELIRRVRALSPSSGGNTPAAALTGYTSAEDRKRVSSAGFQRHLAKPININELLLAVASLAAARVPGIRQSSN